MANPAQVEPAPLAIFWRNLGRIVAQLLTEGAHAEVIVAVQDGKVRLVRVNRSFLPTDLSKV